MTTTLKRNPYLSEQVLSPEPLYIADLLYTIEDAFTVSADMPDQIALPLKAYLYYPMLMRPSEIIGNFKDGFYFCGIRLVLDV